jgi:hypothetical protein
LAGESRIKQIAGWDVLHRLQLGGTQKAAPARV